MDQPTNQVCPTCGLPPATQATTSDRGIATSSLACPLDHVWLVRWPAPAQAAQRAAGAAA